ncbi:MAG: GspH/FimT family pseudopilin [Xanthomonadales bacterium]|nr:GspH/FimT family pseudopilin [Xanthomonadales bacterium]
MIVLIVLAVMVAIATPSFREISLNNRSTSNINNLLADLSMARSEAVKVARTAAVAALGGDWNEGWEVFEDTNGNGIRDAGEALIKTAPAVNVGYEGNTNFLFTLRGVSGAAAGGDPVPVVIFGPLGQTRTPADGARFALCRPGGDAARSTGIRLDPSGRAQAVRNLAGIGLGCS